MMRAVTQLGIARVRPEEQALTWFSDSKIVFVEYCGALDCLSFLCHSSATTTSGGPTTLTQAETVTLGSAAVVSGGGIGSTLWSNGSESYSLYETGQETYGSGASLTQGGGNGNSQSDTYSGSGISALTSTLSTSFSSTQTATTTLGTNATISGGNSTDSFFETGSDSIVSDAGSGTRVRQINYSGSDGSSSTFTTTYSSFDASVDQFTDNSTDAETIGLNGTIASGQNLSTLTSFGSSTYTYYESGNRTISLAAGGFIAGSYTDSETNSESYTISDNTSIALGGNGTIAGGTVASLTTETYTDSQSSYESGAASIPDPEGGPYFGAAFAQSSVTTSYAYSVNQGTETLGALGTISGGGNSFRFIQSDYNSLSMALPETDTASYSMNMSGTETYGPGGSISGGSDNFSWMQEAYDVTTLVLDQTATTSSPGSETCYDFSLNDTVNDSMTDTGSDVLGASDSIISNGDSYTIFNDHAVTNNVADSGSSNTPYYIGANQTDVYWSTDTGTSTLSASGHTLATDTVTYNEFSTDSSSDTESYTNGSYASGNANDYYTDLDVSTITNSNGVTTSYDTFTVTDTHFVYGGDQGLSISSTTTESWADGGNDSNISTFNGTSTPSSDVVTFSDYDISSDSGTSGEDCGAYDASGGNANTATNEMTGVYGSDAEGNYYSTLSSSSVSSLTWDSGTLFDIEGHNYYFSLDNSSNKVLAYTVTGPPASTTTLTSLNTSSDNDTLGPDGDFGAIPATGSAVNAPAPIGIQLGYYSGGAVHNGSDNRGFDTSEGLVSALGGQAVHGLEFTGAEMQVMPEGGTIGIYEYEGNWNGQGPPSTPYESHPSSVGYVRGNQSSGNSAGTQGAAMDSGTRDGTAADELDRLGGSGDAAEENPTSAQPGPTPRAGQDAAMPAAQGIGRGGRPGECGQPRRSRRRCGKRRRQPGVGMQRRRGRGVRPRRRRRPPRR